jgi:hypothetical protein
MSIKNSTVGLLFVLALPIISGCVSIGNVASAIKEKVSRTENLAYFDQRLEYAKSRSRNVLNTFDDSLNKLDSSYDSKYLDAATQAAEMASESKVIAHTIWYLAKDQVLKHGETGAYLELNIGPILKSNVDAHALDVNRLVENLEGELRVISMDLAVELHSTQGNNGVEVRQNSSRTNDWSEFNKTIRNMGFKSTYVAGRVAFNVSSAMSPNIAAPIVESVALISSRVFSKAIGRMAASVSVAVFEGPLPIGKILTVVSAMYTGYEMTQLKPKFRSEILAATKAKLDVVRDDINKHARDASVVSMSAVEKLNADIRAQAF